MLRRSGCLKFENLFKGVNLGRKFVSIGGWCGPALLLGRIGLRTEAYPFDFSRVTLDGVIHFIKDGFGKDFYPPEPKPYRPECVGPYVLFRGQHTAFAHFDLNDEEVQKNFAKKFSRFDHLIDRPEMPVTFLRTVTARDPREELALASQLEECIASRNPCLDFRVVFMVHDQGLRAPSVELAPLSQRMSLWALSYDLTAGDSLFDKCSKAYTSVLMHTVDDANWPLSPVNVARDPLHLSYLYANAEKRVLYADDTVRYGDVSFDDLTAAQFPWRQHDNLALIDGVASVGGTCTGVGSTWMKGAPPSEVEGDAGPSCYYCGNCSFHLAGKPVATNRPFTDEEDETIIVHLYKILTGGDKVEEVEKLAHQMNRGAFEIICRIQYLTAASTKITDDMNPLHPSSL